MNDTVVAILGVVAGFIAAFFAEPVKSWFAEKAKLQNIRLSLYKEIAQNLFFLNSLINSLNDGDTSDIFDWLVLENWISNKCYNSIIENSVDEFYRLDEVIYIDAAYKWINLLLQTSGNSEEVFGDRVSNYTYNYIDFVSVGMKQGMLNGKVMLRAVGKKRMNELLNPSCLKAEIR